MDNITKYFAGERLQCLIGAILSVLLLLSSIYFIYQSKPLLKGISYSVIPLSFLLLTICAGVVWRTPKDINRVTTYYSSEPQKISIEEKPRMEKVMRSFSVIKKVEIFLFLLGLILVFFFTKHQIVRGVGLGLITMCSVLYIFDTIAEARGKEYIEFLKKV